MIKKEKIIEVVETMDDEFEFEDFIEKVRFIHKVELGLKDSDEGRTMTHEKLKEEIRSWFK